MLIGVGARGYLSVLVLHGHLSTVKPCIHSNVDVIGCSCCVTLSGGEAVIEMDGWMDGCSLMIGAKAVVQIWQTSGTLEHTRQKHD